MISEENVRFIYEQLPKFRMDLNSTKMELNLKNKTKIYIVNISNCTYYWKSNCNKQVRKFHLAEPT